MSNLFRSLVFVPGNNPKFLEKAKSFSADVVCFDLEDSVPDKEKKKARVLDQERAKEKKSIFSVHFYKNKFTRLWQNCRRI